MGAEDSRGPKRKVRPAGLEPTATRLEGGCSIQLSYGRVRPFFSMNRKGTSQVGFTFDVPVGFPASDPRPMTVYTGPSRLVSLL
jgi:hypothetical protein